MNLPASFQPPAADPEGERIVRERVRERLRRLLDQTAAQGSADDHQIAACPAREVIRDELAAYNRSAVMDNRPRLPEGESFIQWIEDHALAYGPLMAPLRDPLVEDVYVDGPFRISVLRQGRQVLTTLAFEDEAAWMGTLKKLALAAGRRVDEASPILEGPLPDGSRLQAVIPPIAHPWAYATIRKFPERLRRMSDLARDDADALLSEEGGQFLVGAARAGCNVLIVGPTGSRKTTLLNALLAELSGRSVVIEETQELKVEEIPLAVRLVGRPPNVEGAGEVPLRPLVRTALRMRPRRIVIGEIRGAEALDLLRAMNTGHRSSLTTAHANGARDGLEQLVALAMEGAERVAESSLRRIVARTIGLVVHTDFDEADRPGVLEVWELTGLEGDQFLGHAVLARQAGRLRRTGLPSRWEELARAAHAGSPNGAVVA